LNLLFQIVNLIGYVIFYLAAAGAGLLLLRVVIAWASSNPFLWLPYQLRRVTEPMVRPFRQPFSGYHSRFDLLPLVVAVMVLLAGWFIADMLWRLNFIFASLIGSARYGAQIAKWLILLVGTLYEAAIFLRFLLPWFGFGYSSALMRFLFKMTEPLLKPIRRLLSNIMSMSMFDFTPLIALVLVRIVTEAIAGTIG